MEQLEISQLPDSSPVPAKDRFEFLSGVVEKVPPDFKPLADALFSKEDFDSFKDVFETAARICSSSNHPGLQSLYDSDRGLWRCLTLTILGLSPALKNLRSDYFAAANKEPDLDEHEAEALCLYIRQNTNLQDLNLAYQEAFGTPKCCKALAQMLIDNRSLKSLCLSGTHMVPEAVRELLVGLRENKTLKSIDIHSNLTLGDGGMKLVAEYLCSNETLVAELKIKKVGRKSARLVLCGYGYAGKSTIGRTMRRNANSSTKQQKCKGILSIASKEKGDHHVKGRTCGVDICLLENGNGKKITLWDFAGQKEYCALHDYMFPSLKPIVTSSTFAVHFNHLLLERLEQANKRQNKNSKMNILFGCDSLHQIVRGQTCQKYNL